MNNFPFPTDPIMTALTIAYGNKRLIADQVLPRVPVGGVNFRYRKFDMAEGLTIPDTKVGRKSRPNQVSFTAKEETHSTVDYGLEDPIPSVDMNNAPAGFNPAQHAIMTMTDLILLQRETRVADLVFDPNTYPSGKKTVLSGAEQWSHEESDPIEDILAGIDALFHRPNTMVIGRTGFRALSTHAAIVKSVNRNEGDTGIATRAAIAALFEFDQVLVGEGWFNIANKGQTVDMRRVWGGHCALLFLDPNTRSSEGAPTFGFTGQYLTRVAGAQPDPNIGLRGGSMVRVGESVAEVISAPDLGYFLEDVA